MKQLPANGIMIIMMMTMPQQQQQQQQQQQLQQQLSADHQIISSTSHFELQLLEVLLSCSDLQLINCAAVNVAIGGWQRQRLIAVAAVDSRQSALGTGHSAQL
ncbi:hypothetical protein AWZ03_009812 [Drosophila navojoa]|uniref:Uncharacterized protein n=1 Tax=Drosophila navojoa TaxID=7232 RepID=A0A484B7E9_DRONA|nr:hypothetical protein AWZ03_009812 [Drosophila navojoa]